MNRDSLCALSRFNKMIVSEFELCDGPGYLFYKWPGESARVGGWTMLVRSIICSELAAEFVL